MTVGGLIDQNAELIRFLPLQMDYGTKNAKESYVG